MLKGHCLCGDIRFTVARGARGFSVCHCGQCRRQSGHTWASGFAPRDAIEIEGAVTWFAASDTAQRGFCARCGSFLFWSHNEEETMSFSLGSLEEPTGIHLEKHIFVADKGDYYEIADGLPQQEQ